MINLKSPKQKINEWRTQNVMRRNYETKLAANLKKEFLRTAKTISTNFIISRSNALDLESRNHYSRLKNIIFSHWRTVTNVFATRSFAMIRTIIESEQKAYEDDFDREFENFLFTSGAEKVTNISSTTIANIRNAIDSAQQDGQDVYQTARRILELSEIDSITRAILIARTETHQAANFANFTTLDVVNVPGTTKEWVAVNDARTRDDHAIANGQEVAKDGDFVVGGSLLKYPGDPSAPAQQVVNCRCTFVVNVPEPDFGD